MKVIRMGEIETTFFKVRDLISVGGYAATCQEITPKGALFLMNQYLDKRYPMNIKNTNRGGYEKSYLRKVLQSEEVLNIFKDIRGRMVPFENGDLLRIPFAGEMFGDDDLSRWVEPDVHMICSGSLCVTRVIDKLQDVVKMSGAGFKTK